MADTASGARVIHLRGVCKSYGEHRVVDDIDLSIRQGERFALLGHNGAGKTTLIKMVLGLCRPTAGEIDVHGRLAGTFDKNVAPTGYLPENVSFPDNMSGHEVLRFYARLKRCDNKECEELLARVGLSDAAGQRVRTYSKGMRQRLGLAQAMLGNPSLLLLDEPTTGLDPALRALFYEIIRQRTNEGSTALISSHALGEIESCVDRLAILKNGALVACGSLDDLRRQAGLPTRIRVHVPAGDTADVAERLCNDFDIQKINDRTVDLECVDNQKVEVLRCLGNLDKPILDVDITPVRLEQLYEYFTAGQEVL